MCVSHIWYFIDFIWQNAHKFQSNQKNCFYVSTSISGEFDSVYSSGASGRCCAASFGAIVVRCVSGPRRDWVPWPRWRPTGHLVAAPRDPIIPVLMTNASHAVAKCNAQRLYRIGNRPRHSKKSNFVFRPVCFRLCRSVGLRAAGLNWSCQFVKSSQREERTEKREEKRSGDLIKRLRRL